MLKRLGAVVYISKRTGYIQRMFRDTGWDHGTPLTCGGTCSLARSSFQARMGGAGGAGRSARGYAAMLAGQIDFVNAMLDRALPCQGPHPGY